MKLPFLFSTLIFLTSVPALAAEFSATIENDHVKSGQSVTLQLTLSGTKARNAPDIGALKQFFTIASEVQSSNTIIDSGAASTEVHWQLALVPKMEGRLTIPPVMIETGAGVLRTAPVVLQVDHGSTPIASQTNTDGSVVSITALASTTKPYLNQSIRYTVRCVLRGSISDASLGVISVNDAIVEQQGKPEVHDQFENGLAVRIVEFHYIITPLRPGEISIPPAVMQGKIRTQDITDSFGGGLSSGMRQAMNFFSTFGDTPFKVASNKMQLEVKPPATTMDPWLPLTSLKIMEDTSVSQPAKIGEPLTRKIALLADGAVGSQLPDLEAKQDHKNFRVYADKPTTGEDVDTKSGIILGWRKESYTLIPQKAGPVVLPAIKVRWWDIVNNKAAIAELPERIISVLPVAAKQNLPPVGGRATGQSAPKRSFKGPSVPSNLGFLLLYSLMGVLAGILLFAAIRGLRLWHKINRQVMNNSPAPAKRQRRKLAPRSLAERDLDHVRTAEELQRVLQTYVHARCGVSRNTSLDRSFLALSNSWTAKERDDIDAVIKGIGAALYAGKVVEVEDLKKRCRRIIAALNGKSKNSQKDGEKLRCLNPS